jgi:catechol 2,3-dioxygenase-like lactoylglutathione lyase family enzyme
MAMHVTHLRKVVLASPRPERLADFYEQTWGLRRVESPRSDHFYMRGSGPEHHILVIRPASRPAVVGYSLGLEDRDAVDQAAKEMGTTRGVMVCSSPGPITEPGGGYGFSISDVDGRRIELSAEVEGVEEVAEVAAAGAGRPVEPVKISHLVVNSPNAEDFAQLFVDVLGFRTADEMPHMLFLRCSTDHHSVAVVRAPHASLNHVAFEVPTVDDMLRGIEQMNERGYEVLWGPGRHGPGNNTFGYFLAPNRQVIEYTSEVQQVFDEEEVAPKMWLPEEMRVYDSWADPASARPTARTRELMLGESEALVGRPSVVNEDEGGG